MQAENLMAITPLTVHPIDAPIQFHPLLKPRVWGGRTLERLGKSLPPGQKIGESWEVADLPPSIPDGRSIVAAPQSLAGRSLHEALRDSRTRRAIMGDVELSPDAGFPLLIKYLDARENLSVQVHPSVEYARRHPGAHVKSEAWVVIAADPGAVIYKGLKPGVTREAFAQHIRENTVVNDLVAVPVKPGDCHYLPSGTCHALGAGILVAEVQTPSDTTFRVFDWGRPATAGRELHIEQALECIDFASSPPQQPVESPIPNKRQGLTTMRLTRTEFFEIERVDADAGSGFHVVTQTRPEIWMVMAGGGEIRGDSGHAVDLQPGMTILVPAAARDWQARFDERTWLLCVRLPSPLRKMIA